MRPTGAVDSDDPVGYCDRPVQDREVEVDNHSHNTFIRRALAGHDKCHRSVSILIGLGEQFDCGRRGDAPWDVDGAILVLGEPHHGTHGLVAADGAAVELGREPAGDAVGGQQPRVLGVVVDRKLGEVVLVNLAQDLLDRRLWSGDARLYARDVVPGEGRLEDEVAYKRDLIHDLANRIGDGFTS